MENNYSRYYMYINGTLKSKANTLPELDWYLLEHGDELNVRRVLDDKIEVDYISTIYTKPPLIQQIKDTFSQKQYEICMCVGNFFHALAEKDLKNEP